MTPAESAIDKINALLRKAEDRAVTPEEAETFLQGAQRLMRKYAIEQFMLDSRRDKQDDKVVQAEIRYDGSYHQGWFRIGQTLAEANDCKVLISKDWRNKNASIMIMIGFQSDVERVKMLDASVRIQAQTALTRYARDGGVRPSWTAMEKYKARRSFLFGYAAGIKIRLDRANREAESDVSDSQESVALVLASRSDRVTQAMNEMYPETRVVKSRLSAGDHGAYRHGRERGLEANTGSSGALGADSPRLNR